MNAADMRTILTSKVHQLRLLGQDEQSAFEGWIRTESNLYRDQMATRRFDADKVEHEILLLIEELLE